MIKIKKKKKVSKIKKLLILILLVIIIALIYIVSNIYLKFKKVDFEKLNKDELSANEGIYNELSNHISESEFNEVKTVVFFGIDSKDSFGGMSGRSDTIIIASINPKQSDVSLISIPRDTYVNIPGYGKDKINHAYAFGKEMLAIKTINENFELNITEYVTIDFSGLIKIINKVGGIELEITEAEKGYINNAVNESYNISGNKVEKLNSHGKVRLTGEQALTHSRNRTIGDDFVRASRQRKVLEALIVKISSLDALNIYNISDSILSEVKTNIEINKYINTAIKVAAAKDKYINKIQLTQIPAAEYSQGKTINGIYYFTTDYTKARTDFIKYIYGIE